MNTKHTQGPWKAQRDIRHFTNTGCLTKESAKGWAVYGPSQRIACVSSDIGVQWDQDKLAEADAMLIAMAPDLLAISQRIHDEINGLNATLRACDARYEKSVLCQRLNDLIRDNAAVLQKATGEQ